MNKVFAQEPAEITNPALSETIRKLTGIQFLQKFLPNLIILFLISASLVSFFILIIGGIQWMTAGGDKAATESARGRITAAIIGLVLVFTVFAIMKLLSYLLGIDLLTIEIGRLMLK